MSTITIARKYSISVGAAIVLSLACSFASQAGVINVDLSDYVGTRKESDALPTTVVLDDWATDAKDFSISWSITENAGVYTYVYTVDGYGGKGSPNISHLSVAASDGRPGTDIFTEDNVLNGSDPVEVGSLNDGMFGAPSDLYGFKFDFGDDAPFVYTLVTDRAPIWGSYFAKAGRDSGAYNTGFGIFNDYLADFDSSTDPDFNKLQWIAVPDSNGIDPPGPVVPEPSTIASVLCGLIPLGIARARRIRRARTA